MRMRTNAKRREIVEAAAALFIEQGYDRTSMSAISDRLGGSKATLYGYFPSKEELLRAVLAHDIAEETARLVPVLPVGDDLRAELVTLGVRYLEARLADMPIANLRTVANQPRETGIGADFYAGVLRPAWELVSDRFAELMDRGLLQPGDPWVAAMQWRALVECDLVEKRLLGVIAGPHEVDLEAQARAAADAFLAIHGRRDVPVADVA